MKLLCEVCERAEATIVCCQDEAAMCAKCDTEVHGANVLAQKHQRLPLSRPKPEALPLCDICQKEKGNFYCANDRAVLCRSCDYAIHTANADARLHARFPFVGTSVSLEVLAAGQTCMPCPPSAAVPEPPAAAQATPAPASDPPAAAAGPSTTAVPSTKAIFGLDDEAEANDFNVFLTEHDMLSDMLVPDLARDSAVPSLGPELTTPAPQPAGGAQAARAVPVDESNCTSDGVVPDFSMPTVREPPLLRRNKRARGM